MMPKLSETTFEGLNKLSSDHEFLEMIDDLPANKWYFRGHFGGNQFICKVYNKDLLPSVQRHIIWMESSQMPTKVEKMTIWSKFWNGLIKNTMYSSFLDSSPRTALDVVMKNGPQNEMTSKKLIRNCRLFALKRNQSQRYQIS